MGEGDASSQGCSISKWREDFPVVERKKKGRDRLERFETLKEEGTGTSVGEKGGKAEAARTALSKFIGRPHE